MRRQDGFTLIETMVAMVIGLVTLTAAFSALDTFTNKSQTAQHRSDNTQKARQALDVLVRALRSQACTGPGGTSVLAGSSGTSIAYVTDLGDGTTAPEERIETWTASTRLLTDTRYAGTKTGTTLTFASTPTKYGAQLSNVEPDKNTDGTFKPIFSFYGYDTAVPPRPTVALPVPLTAVDSAKVAKIGVSFRVGAGAGKRDANTGALVQDEIFMRSADPADPAPVPLCP